MSEARVGQRALFVHRQCKSLVDVFRETCPCLLLLGTQSDQNAALAGWLMIARAALSFECSGRGPASDPKGSPSPAGLPSVLRRSCCTLTLPCGGISRPVSAASAGSPRTRLIIISFVRRKVLEVSFPALAVVKKIVMLSIDPPSFRTVSRKARLSVEILSAASSARFNRKPTWHTFSGPRSQSRLLSIRLSPSPSLHCFSKELWRPASIGTPVSSASTVS